MALPSKGRCLAVEVKDCFLSQLIGTLLKSSQMVSNWISWFCINIHWQFFTQSVPHVRWSDRNLDSCLEPFLNGGQFYIYLHSQRFLRMLYDRRKWVTLTRMPSHCTIKSNEKVKLNITLHLRLSLHHPIDKSIRVSVPTERSAGTMIGVEEWLCHVNLAE